MVFLSPVSSSSRRLSSRRWPPSRRAALAGCLAAASLLCGCADGAQRTLQVSLRTDFAVGREVDQARVIVAAERVDEASAPREVTETLDPSGDYIGGHPIAEIRGFEEPLGYLRVELLDAGGAAVARQDLVVDTRADTSVTVIITRSCGGVSCPSASDPPDFTACVGGSCANPACVGAGEGGCAPPECTTDDDCSPRMCSPGVCRDSECFYELDDSMCSPDRMCAAPGLCVRRDRMDGAVLTGDGGVGGDGGGALADGAIRDGALDGARPDSGLDISDHYCPTDPLTRAQAAVFFVKLWERDPAYEPPPISSSRFSDVDPTAVQAPWIERLAELGITEGCEPGLYCPSEPLRRIQAAVMLLRAYYRNVAYTPPAASGEFDDVSDPDNLAWAEQFVEAGFSDGCAPRQFCPTDAVQRQHAALFVIKGYRGPGYIPPDPIGLFVDVELSGRFAPWIEQLARDGFTRGCIPSP